MSTPFDGLLGPILTTATNAATGYQRAKHERRLEDMAAQKAADAAKRQSGLDDLFRRKTEADILQSNAAAVPKVTPPRKTYDAKRGVMVNEDEGTAAPITGLPDVVPDTPSLSTADKKRERVQALVATGMPLDKANRQTQQEFGEDVADIGGNQAMKVSNVLTFRGQFAADPTVKNSAEIVTGLKKVRAAANEPSAAGDMALLYGYNKLLDPGSVVRESEFATLAKSGSLGQQMQSYVTKLANGQRLTPEQRSDFIDRSEKLAKAQMEQHQGVSKRYTDMASRYGVDPRDIVGDPFEGLFTAPATAPTAPGGDALAQAIAKIDAAFQAGDDTPERRAKRDAAIQAARQKLGGGR